MTDAMSLKESKGFHSFVSYTQCLAHLQLSLFNLAVAIWTALRP